MHNIDVSTIRKKIIARKCNYIQFKGEDNFGV